jgi:hypothetical protein
VCVCVWVAPPQTSPRGRGRASFFLAHLFVSVSDLGIGLVGGGWVAVVEWQGSERLSHSVVIGGTVTHCTERTCLSTCTVSGLAHQRRTAGKWADTMSASVYAPIAEAPGWGADELDPVVVVMPPARTKSKMPTVWDNRCDAPTFTSSRAHTHTSAAGGTTLYKPTVVVVSLRIQSPPFTAATSPALPLSHSAQLACGYSCQHTAALHPPSCTNTTKCHIPTTTPRARVRAL